MKYPIPDDWDGVTWECYQIQFPSSLRWDAILNGWLSSLFKGRVWDETSGTITDVQTIMREMWDRNKALAPCDLNCATCVTQICGTGGGSGDSDESEEYDMPCLNLAEKIKLEDGHLWVYDDCCCSWTDMGSVKAAAVEALPPDPLNPTGDPGVTYYACGKASSAVDLIVSMANNVWDEVDNMPWSWVSHVESGVGINGENTYILNAVMQAILMTGVGYDRSEVITVNDAQWMKTMLSTELLADADPVTRDQWDDFRGAVRSHWGIDVYMRNFWDYVILATGFSNFANASALGATDDTADCSLPAAGIADPTGDWGTAWTWFKDFTKTQWDTTTPNVSLWTSGKGWHKEDTDTGYQDIQVDIPCITAQDGSYITRAWVRLRLTAGMAYINTETTLLRTFSSQEIMTQADVGDTDPSMGGVIIMQDVVNTQCNAATWPLKFRLEGDVATPATEVAYLEAIALGGTGVSPFL